MRGLLPYALVPFWHRRSHDGRGGGASIAHDRCGPVGVASTRGARHKGREVPGTGGRAIPELWLLGTEALALAMEVPVLEAKRLGHRAVLRLSWLLLVASVALSTLLQVTVAPPKC